MTGNTKKGINKDDRITLVLAGGASALIGLLAGDAVKLAGYHLWGIAIQIVLCLGGLFLIVYGTILTETSRNDKP